MHCNYGWEGTCDGYYTSGVFNPSNQLNLDHLDLTIGDSAGTKPYNFNLELYYYKYSK